MVKRQIRNPPLLAGQRRYNVLTWVTTSFVVYIAVIFSSFSNTFNEDSLFGQLQRWHNRKIGHFFGLKEQPWSVEVYNSEKQNESQINKSTE